VDADLGYFGPDSITWRVHAEPVTMVGGLRALLLQALHPEAMRLLYERSNFQDDPWARLTRTAQYVATVSFAPRDEVDAAAARVRGVHARLGIADPEQLAWVHACQVDSFLLAARRSGLPLDATDADRYVAEQALAASLVDVPARLVPLTVADLDAYLLGMRPRLALTPEAVRAARHVLAPALPVATRWHIPARAGWTTIAATAVGLLPTWARRMYRLPWLPGTGMTAAASLHVLRRAVGTLPAQWRQGPSYQDALRRQALAAR
jgi:uncharacterized protein (DUF2236 family)